MAHPRSLLSYAPAKPGPGDGKAFFFFFGFACADDHDRNMRQRVALNLGDDIASLRAAGYRVVFDYCGTKASLEDALLSRHPENRGTETAGISWCGHGDPAGIFSHEAESIGPEALSPEIATKKSLKLLVLLCCWTGMFSGAWKKLVGEQCRVEAWWYPITAAGSSEYFQPKAETVDEFDDLVRTIFQAPNLGEGPFTETKEIIAIDREHAAHYEHNPLAIDPSLLAVGKRYRVQYIDDLYVPCDLVEFDGNRWLANRMDGWLGGHYPKFWVQPYQIRPLEAPEAAALPDVPRIGSEVEAPLPDGSFHKAKLIDRRGDEYLARFEGKPDAWVPRARIRGPKPA